MRGATNGPSYEGNGVNMVEAKRSTFKINHFHVNKEEWSCEHGDSKCGSEEYNEHESEVTESSRISVQVRDETVTSLLDSGAGVSVCSKALWDKVTLYMIVTFL